MNNNIPTLELASEDILLKLFENNCGRILNFFILIEYDYAQAENLLLNLNYKNTEVSDEYDKKVDIIRQKWLSRLESENTST